MHGAINMLGLARRVNAKILQASTSEVYDDPKVHPQTEDYWGHVSPIGIRSCCDEGKRCAETLFLDYYRQNRLRIKVIELTGSLSQIAFKPLPSDDPTQRQPDIGLAKNRLGWGSAFPPEAGLRRAIEYFRGERG